MAKESVTLTGDDVRRWRACSEMAQACFLILRGWDRVRRNRHKAISRFQEWAGDEATDFGQGLADARIALAQWEGRK